MPINILIDPGHGGTETGAMANGYIEKDLNLTTALFLREDLKRQGFSITMTRDKDITMDLDTRGKMAAGHNMLLSIHFNSSGGSGGKGFEGIHSLYNDSAKWLAMCVSKEVAKLGLHERGIWSKESSAYRGRNYYGVLRSAEPVPGVILEGLFLDNAVDVENLKKPDFLKNLSTAYTKGICTAYSIKYVDLVPVVNEHNAEWLFANGYTKSIHKKSEPLTYGDLENILKNKQGL